MVAAIPRAAGRAGAPGAAAGAVRPAVPNLTEILLLLLPRTIISGYSPDYPTKPHPLAERFGIILGLLCKGLTDPRARCPLDPARTMLLWKRLARLVQRVAALIALATQPGGLVAPPPRVRRTPAPPAECAAPGPDAPTPDSPTAGAPPPGVLPPGALPPGALAAPGATPAPPPKPARLCFPRRPGWLRAVSLDTAAAGSQLRYFLNDAEMAALLAATPALGRLLRPLCRMLGVVAPGIPAAPQRPRPPRAPRPPRPRKWRPGRRVDLMALIGMGRPFPGF